MSIEEVDLPIRMRSPHQSRKRVDDGAEVVLHPSPFATAAVTRECASLRVNVDDSVPALPSDAMSRDAREVPRLTGDCLLAARAARRLKRKRDVGAALRGDRHEGIDDTMVQWLRLRPGAISA
jgi:hypothetical protein